MDTSSWDPCESYMASADDASCKQAPSLDGCAQLVLRTLSGEVLLEWAGDFDATLKEVAKQVKETKPEWRQLSVKFMRAGEVLDLTAGIKDVHAAELTVILGEMSVGDVAFLL